MTPGCFRFFLAWVVVMHHSTPLRLGGWAVSVFFVLSGYWIGRMWDEKYQRVRLPVWTFVVSRWWRLVPVFLVCTGLAWISAVLLSIPEGVRDLSWGWWLRQIPIVGSTWDQRILPPAWSLDVEMQFYLVAALGMPLLGLVSHGTRLGVLLVCVPLCLWWHTKGPFQGFAHGEESLLLVWGLFFLSGLLIHSLSWNPGKAMRWASVIVACGFLVFIFVHSEVRQVLWRRGAEMLPITFPSGWTRSLAAIWPTLLVALLIPWIAGNVRENSSKLDRLLGNWAYPLYLFHWVPREWYYAWVDWSSPLWNNFLLLLANFAVAALGSWVILTLVDVPMNRWRAAWVTSRLQPREARLKGRLPDEVS